MLDHAQQRKSGVALKALRRRNDGWVLVVDKLVRVASGHYKPQRSWVRGDENILQVVAKCRGTDFVDEVRSALNGEHECYRIDGDQISRWNPESSKETFVRAKDFTRLVEKCRSMEHRIGELESTLKRLAKSALRRKGSGEGDEPQPAPRGGSTRSKHGAGGGSASAEPSAPAQREAENTDARERREHDSQEAKSTDKASARGADAGEAAKDQAAAGSEQASPKPSEQEGGAAQESAAAMDETGGQPDAAGVSDGADDPALEKGAPLPAPPTSDPLLQFPTADVYGKALSELIDAEVSLNRDDEITTYSDTIHYFTELIDDDDTVVGAIVADLTATVYQGGTLMMLGDDILKESVEGGDVHEDLEEGMKEILNVQSRCFNDTEGNPHLRVSGLRRVGDADGWLRESMHRAVYEDSFGGRTWLLSK